MTTIHILSSTLLAVALVATAYAQPAAPMPMMAASMPNDCATPPAKHDHGAEKGTPKPKSMSAPCGPAAATAASAPRK